MNNLDPSIITLAKKGNLASFEQIVTFYERPIYSFLFRHCSHSQTAEDLTQETFIKLYKNIKNADPKNNITSWIFTIATNVFYDYLRKKKHVQELFIIDDPDVPFETIDESQTYTIVEQSADSDMIEQALSNLKPQYKTVLIMFYKYDLTYENIASNLKIPINTVKTYLHRAKKALKDNLWTK